MQENVEINQNILIQDLGTGFAYVNIGRSIVPVESDEGQGEKIITQYQLRLPLPIVKGDIIDAVCDEMKNEITQLLENEII